MKWLFRNVLTMSNLLGILLVLCVAFYPFCIPLSVLSLKYHASLYHVSSQTLKTFIDNLWLPLRVFYSRFLGKMYWDYAEYSPERVAASLMSQRIIASIIPVMFVIATIVGGVRVLLQDHVLAWDYVLLLSIICISLYFAWQFGHRLSEPQEIAVKGEDIL